FNIHRLRSVKPCACKNSTPVLNAAQPDDVPHAVGSLYTADTCPASLLPSAGRTNVYEWTSPGGPATKRRADRDGGRSTAPRQADQLGPRWVASITGCGMRPAYAARHDRCRTMHTAGTSATVASRAGTAEPSVNTAAYGGGTASPETAAT